MGVYVASETSYDFHFIDFNIMDLFAVYTPPTVSGQVLKTSHLYNLDGDLISTTRPDGQVVTNQYEANTGRLLRVGTSSYYVDVGYDSKGRVSGRNTSDGVNLRYDDNEMYLSLREYSGPFSLQVKTYKNMDIKLGEKVGSSGVNFLTSPLNNKVSAVRLDGGATLANLDYDGSTGLYVGRSSGVVSEQFGYSNYGEVSTQSSKVSGSEVYGVAYTRDKLGRIQSKIENILGSQVNWSYEYDLAGRLVKVAKNGQENSYTYDANGNRIGGSIRGQGVTAQYDEQDRLVTYNNLQMTYNANGDLSTKLNTQNSETTVYQYDVFGALRSVEKTGADAVVYQTDGENRRVAKYKAGTFVRGYVYNVFGQLVGELDANKVLVAQYVYVSSSHSPDYIVRADGFYNLIKDNLGSIRMVVNSTTGTVIQRLNYDEFGVVIEDNNPGFQPFGFAGGLYDGDTKLIRFGARDYDADVGRWTARDPIGFEGGSNNLYGYVLQDPINKLDPDGRFVVVLPVVIPATEIALGIATAYVCANAPQIVNAIDNLIDTLTQPPEQPKNNCPEGYEAAKAKCYSVTKPNSDARNACFASAYNRCVKGE